MFCCGQELLREVRWLWGHAGGERQSAKSFWIGKDDTPRCCLEAFAQKCAAFHYPDYLGAEYWVSAIKYIYIQMD